MSPRMSAGPTTSAHVPTRFNAIQNGPKASSCSGRRASATQILDDQDVSLLDARGRGRSRRQLERRVRPARAGDPPGTQLVPDTDDLVLAIEKDGVDRKAHEEHV